MSKNIQSPTPQKVDYNDAVAESKVYFDGDDLAATVWVSKYALKDSFGNIYEKSPRQMHERIAREIERIEKKYPNPMSADEVFALLDHFRYVIPQALFSRPGAPCRTTPSSSAIRIPPIPTAVSSAWTRSRCSS